LTEAIYSDGASNDFIFVMHNGVKILKSIAYIFGEFKKKRNVKKFQPCYLLNVLKE